MNNGYLLLHGWQNRRPEGHWHNWLNRELTAAGCDTAYPQLPKPDEPDLDEWLATLDRELAALKGTERIIVGHSLGAAALINALSAPESNLQDRVTRVLLVSPPSTSVMQENPQISGFVTPEEVKLAVPTRLVGSDADPYCPEGIAEFYGPRLGLTPQDIDVIPGGGHLSLDDGYGAWPSVLAWCLDPTTRITTNKGTA